MRIHGILGSLALVCLIGCGGADQPTGEPTDDTAADAGAQDVLDESGGVAIEFGGGSAEEPAETSTPDEPAVDEPASEDQSEMERVKAEAGVGVQGQSLEEHEGFTVTPVKAYFSVQQRLVFEASLPKAMQLYQATNGDYPKTHEEFMTQIIEANGIQLPRLPAGEKYLYDPETHELMVERPR